MPTNFHTPSLSCRLWCSTLSVSAHNTTHEIAYISRVGIKRYMRSFIPSAIAVLNKLQSGLLTRSGQDLPTGTSIKDQCGMRGYNPFSQWTSNKDIKVRKVLKKWHENTQTVSSTSRQTCHSSCWLHLWGSKAQWRTTPDRRRGRKGIGHTQRPKDTDRALFQLATEQSTHWAKKRTLGHSQSEDKGGGGGHKRTRQRFFIKCFLKRVVY